MLGGIIVANKLKFCQNCGNKIVKKERFCRYCGYNFGMAQNPQGTRAWRRRSKKPAIITITSLVLVGSLAITGFWYPGFIKNYFLTLEPSVKMQEAKEASVKIPVNTNGKGTTVGGIEESGYSIHVADGAFPKEGTLTVTPFDQKKLSNIKNKSAYEFLSTPVEINCDAYSGGFFAEDVVYTVPLPKEAKDLGRYVFGCIDEETGEVRYLEPDSYDLENGTMSVVLPHFSSWFAAKITKEEEKERFLDKYSMQLAIDESEQKRAAAELEPYVKAKVKALGLTEQATADLVQSTINYMSGCFKDAEGNKIDWKETAGKAITSVARGVYEKDPETIQSGLEDTLNGALMHAWEENKFNDKIDKVLGSEFAGGAVGTLLSSSNGVARMAGRLMEGDVKGAAEELGGVMQNVHPSVELCTKSANLLLALGNTSMVYWKSNMVDEMYNIYKNGAEGLFGIEVEPQNKKSFLAYFNNEYGGISAYRCVSRFYNLDKIAEVCERYGWEEKTYNELSEEKKAIFNKRAQDSLMEYFELRLKQEKRAAEIKEMERKNIEEMLNPYYGALNSGFHRKFFGESSYRDYSMTNRLEHLVNVRRFISQYINQEKINSKSNEYNMGFLLNRWVILASDNPKDIAITKFCKLLKSIDMLNEDYDFPEVTADDLEGTYTGTVTVKALRVTEELYRWYKIAQFAGQDLSNDLKDTFGEDYTADTGMGNYSKAECDEALSQYADQVKVSQEIKIERTGKNDFKVCGWILSEDGKIPMSAPAVFKDSTLTLKTEEGTTEIEATMANGAVLLEGGDAVLLVSEQQEGMTVSYLVEISIKVTKK